MRSPSARASFRPRTSNSCSPGSTRCSAGADRPRSLAHRLAKGDIVRNSHYGLGFWLAQNGTEMEAVIYGSAQGRLTVSGHQDNAWHHMVATANGTTMALYLDGALKGTTPLSGTLNLWNDNLAVGAIDSNAEYFAGSIDEVAIYASALSADQVGTHFVVGRSTDRNLLTTRIC